MKMKSLLIAMTLSITALATTPAISADPIQVFILAGQSNMEGKAKVSLLDHQITAPETEAFFQHLHVDGEYIVRDDVSINYLERHGNLTVGYGSPGRFGVELEFGNLMGNHFDQPVLLIKAAWGGKSIVRDFRPPSAGFPSDEDLNKILEDTNNRNRERNQPEVTLDDIKENYGHFYRLMMEEINTTLDEMGTLFPELEGQEYEIAGFVWFQGWNDQYNGAELEYASNMAHFIRDVRRDLETPDLPFVIGVMGQNQTKEATGAMLTIQEAQLSIEEMPEFQDNVKAVRTDELVDLAAAAIYPEWRTRLEEWEKVGGDFGYHYMGSAIWFSRMGTSFGETMLELMGE